MFLLVPDSLVKIRTVISEMLLLLFVFVVVFVVVVVFVDVVVELHPIGIQRQLLSNLFTYRQFQTLWWIPQQLLSNGWLEPFDKWMIHLLRLLTLGWISQHFTSLTNPAYTVVSFVPF